ncbi:hypothetical protein [Streptomyces sp. NBC_01439]|uniref:hypothetical protein n=1 Tax=Streptomyces sp. NBC_01439 TaxID=2903867 RepID=UPI002E29928F|nr:hypothetical protein [Streptomyces sp. NBC_01439]
MRRTAAAGAGALTAVTVLAASLAGCGGGSEEDRAVPEKLCGTPVPAGLSKPLLEPYGKITESSRVDRQKPQTAPCVVAVDGERALAFRFAWHPGAPEDLLATARQSSVVGLTDPARVNLGFEDSVLGNEGATATTACRTQAGDHFTLTVIVSRAAKDKADLRPAVERFMRTYMAETVKTLNCA